ncbi:hypothetical protein ABT097_04660 [Streptomyces sp. NPDC002225]|uniref:hypothetical protein n=1 Tax=Streptomyces sp. NPDC002225 TaxID=3154413 RepID=UPI00332E2F7C
MNSSTRLCGHFVCCVLNELEKLPIAISALGDSALTIGVFGDEARIDCVGLQDA